MPEDKPDLIWDTIKSLQKEIDLNKERFEVLQKTIDQLRKKNELLERETRVQYEEMKLAFEKIGMGMYRVDEGLKITALEITALLEILTEKGLVTEEIFEKALDKAAQEMNERMKEAQKKANANDQGKEQISK